MSSARIVMPALAGMLALSTEAAEAPARRSAKLTTASRPRRAARTRRSLPMSELFPLPWLLVVGAAEQSVPATPTPMTAKK
jgi:hypothetical protein